MDILNTRTVTISVAGLACFFLLFFSQTAAEWVAITPCVIAQIANNIQILMLSRRRAESKQLCSFLSRLARCRILLAESIVAAPLPIGLAAILLSQQSALSPAAVVVGGIVLWFLNKLILRLHSVRDFSIRETVGPPDKTDKRR